MGLDGWDGGVFGCVYVVCFSDRGYTLTVEFLNHCLPADLDLVSNGFPSKVGK